MASDLKIEIFAYTFFHNLFFECGYIKSKSSIYEVFGEECCKVENCTEACKEIFMIAACCRNRMFRCINMADFTDEKAKSLKSLSDCYDYILFTCNRHDFFGHLTVFERMLDTCSFVLNLCIRLQKYNIVNLLKYGHTLWSMYFDGFTKEFYDKGGWEELEVVSEPYSRLHLIFYSFNEGEFKKLHELVEEYYDFFHVDNDSGLSIAKLWINFRLEKLNDCVRTRVCNKKYSAALEVEELINKLICLLEDIETPVNANDEYLNKLSLTNPERQGEIPDLREISSNRLVESLGLRNVPPCSVSNSMTFSLEKSVKDNVEEVSPEKTLGENYSLTSHMAESGLGVSSYLYISSEQSSDNSFSTIGEKQKIEKAREDLRNEQKDSNMKIFLTMLLVLDERLAMASVRNALQSNEDDPHKTKGIGKKRKKKKLKKCKE